MNTCDMQRIIINVVFSFFISTTGKRAFETGRALAGIIPYYVCSVHHME